MSDTHEAGSRFGALLRWSRVWGQRKVDEVTLDRTGLTASHQRLISAGYLGTIGLLIAVLASALVSEPQAEFADRYGSHAVSIALVVLFATTFIVGWAFVLAGASDAPRKVFLTLLGLCVFQLYGLSPSSGTQLLVLLAGVGLIALLLVRGPATIWLRYPTAELIAWLVLLSAAYGLGFASATDPSEPIEAQYFAARLVVLVSLPVWIWLGFDSVRASVDLGRSTATRARSQLASRNYRALAGVVTLGWPAVVVGLTVAVGAVAPGAGAWLPFILFMAVPLAIWCVLDVVHRRWTDDRATLVLALNVSFAAATLAIVLTAVAPVEAFINGLHVLPPLFLFTLLAAYNVVIVGGREAERGGGSVPRSGRVLMFFGAVLLVIGSLAFLSGVTEPDAIDGAPASGDGTESRVENSAALIVGGAPLIGVLLLGLPYYALTVRSRRDRLTSPVAPPSEGFDIEGISGGRPSTPVLILWVYLGSMFVVFTVVIVAMMLAVTIVGIPAARRLLARLPGLMTLRGIREIPGAAASTPRPAVTPAQPPLFASWIWFLTLGWWLAAVWVMVAWLVALPIVTLQTSARMLARTGAVMTLEGAAQ